MEECPKGVQLQAWQSWIRRLLADNKSLSFVFVNNQFSFGIWTMLIFTSHLSLIYNDAIFYLQFHMHLIAPTS